MLTPSAKEAAQHLKAKNTLMCIKAQEDEPMSCFDDHLLFVLAAKSHY